MWLRTQSCQQVAPVDELKVVAEVTCCTGGAAWSVGRNLPAIHVCQTDVWVQTHVEVIATDKQEQTSRDTFHMKNLSML